MGDTMRLHWLAILLLLAFVAPAYADTVNFGLNTDDYGWLQINGATVVFQDCWGSCGNQNPVSLSGGWYDVDIKYLNRWGSTNLFLSQDYTSGTGDQTLVPLSWLRSRDATGAWISGLQADYYTLASRPAPGEGGYDAAVGTYLGTVYGEGPIGHGYASGFPYWYEGQQNVSGYSWGPYISDAGWGSFAEHLTGQIYMPGPVNGVPEPATFVLLGSGLFGLAVAVRGRRK